ncbi:hypothetical protein FIM44_07710, partial [Helicobacter pylori]
LFLCRNSTISGFRLLVPKVIASLPLVGISALLEFVSLGGLLRLGEYLRQKQSKVIASNVFG